MGRELPAGREIITVCRSAGGMLAADGHPVRNLSGGMRARSAAGPPVIAEGGRAGSVR
jgi:hypothetical protein